MNPQQLKNDNIHKSQAQESDVQMNMFNMDARAFWSQ